jgi:hypothetical protein
VRRRLGVDVWARGVVLARGLAISSVLAGWAMTPQSASAAQLKCESHTLADDDEASLRAKARTLLPKTARLDSVQSCRNPANALAWVSTRKTTTPEAVAQWWELTCQRQAVVWECSAPEFKQFVELTLLVGGQSRHIELSFDKESTLQSARLLASQALDMYSDPASPVASCGVKEPKDEDRLGVKKNHGSLPTGTNPIQVSVTHNDEGNSAWLDDVGVAIEFRVKPGDGASPGAACWNEIVIVT